MVILRDRLELGGDGIEPGGLGGELPCVGVGTSYDFREGEQRGIGQLVLVEEGIERTARSMMAKLDVRNIVRNGPPRPATCRTWLLGTNRKVGSLSMKRLINQGQAIRSTRAFSRVTHFICCASPYLRLFVWSSADFSASASFVGSSLAQKCM